MAMHRGIPNLTPALLRKISSAVRAYGDSHTGAAMKKLGFVWTNAKRSGTTCCGFFLNKKKKLLVKESYTSGSKPKWACPTIKLRGPNRYDNLYLQPFCDTSREAVKAAWDTALRHDFRGWGSDCHRGNVGLFRDKPVQFDW